MLSPLSSFFLGLLCTCGLFALSLLLVIGGKILIISFKEKFFPAPAEKVAPPPKAPVIKRRVSKPKTISKPVRSIEIDPEQVDKIYVKKIS